MFSIGESDKKLSRILKKRIPKSAYQCCIEDEKLLHFGTMDLARTIMVTDGGQTIIRFGKNPSHSTVAHEIFHAVEFLMIKLNMPLSLQNDEAWAYLIGYITGEYYDAIVKSK